MDHALETLQRLAAVQRAIDPRRSVRRVARQPAQHQQLGAERASQRVQPRLAPRAAQVVERLLHLQRVAGGVAEHLVHVGDERPRRQPRAFGHAHEAQRQFAGVFRRCREGAVAGLHVHHQRLQPGGELLGQDAGGDQRGGFDRRGHVADRVEPPVGRRHGGRSADDGAAGRAQRRDEFVPRELRAVAGQALQLVQRAARVPEPAPRHHRHPAAARRDDRRQHQAHLVADAAGRVLVHDRRVIAEIIPAQHVAAASHRLRQRDGFRRVHAAQHDGHRQRSRLRIAPAAGDEAVDEGVDLRGGEGVAVAF